MMRYQTNMVSPSFLPSTSIANVIHTVGKQSYFLLDLGNNNVDLISISDVFISLFVVLC